MNAQPKNYKITIFGEQYAFMSDESEQHVAFVAHMVDSSMNDVAQKMMRVPAQKIAVFVALQLASKLVHEQTINKQSFDYCEELTKRIASALDS